MSTSCTNTLCQSLVPTHHVCIEYSLLYKQCMLQCKVLTFYLWCHLDIRVCMLLICGNHMQDRIISLRGEVGVHKTRLAPPLFIEAPVPNQESYQSCMCLLAVWILPLFTNLIFQFGTLPTVWYSSDSLVLFRQFGTLPTVWYSSDSLVLFRQCGTLPTVWYSSDTLPTVWYSSDSLVLFRQCGTLPTVWYSSDSLVLFRHSSDSVVFMLFIS
jgi:hypothetical protein